VDVEGVVNDCHKIEAGLTKNFNSKDMDAGSPGFHLVHKLIDFPVNT
jgi:hypothetical protein